MSGLYVVSFPLPVCPLAAPDHRPSSGWLLHFRRHCNRHEFRFNWHWARPRAARPRRGRPANRSSCGRPFKLAHRLGLAEWPPDVGRHFRPFKSRPRDINNLGEARMSFGRKRRQQRQQKLCCRARRLGRPIDGHLSLGSAGPLPGPNEPRTATGLS